MVATLVRIDGRFAVKIKLDGESAKLDLPVGSGGSAAIYTDRLRGTHIIRRVMVRKETWLNYIF
jgi:hypothetical protein